MSDDWGNDPIVQGAPSHDDWGNDPIVQGGGGNLTSVVTGNKPQGTPSQSLGFYKGFNHALDRAATGTKWLLNNASRAYSEPGAPGFPLGDIIDNAGQKYLGLPSTEESVAKTQQYLNQQQQAGRTPGGWGEFGGDVVGTIPTMAMGPAAGGAVAGMLLGDSDTPTGLAGDAALGAAGGKLADVGVRAASRGIGKLVSRAVANRTAKALGSTPAEQEATSYVSGLVDKAGKTAADVDAVGQKSFGKPVTGAEAIGRPGIGALGALGRRAGTTPNSLDSLLGDRMSGAGGRLIDDFSQAAGIDPALAEGDIQTAVAKGRAAAKPLYDKAFSGGSSAVLMPHLENAFADAVQQERVAGDAVREASQNLTLAKAKGTGTENVYAQNSALSDERAANAQLDAATDAHAAASEAKDTALQRLRMAQQDEATGRRGGVWSPRIQQFLDDPILKKGLAKGVQLQRLDALAEGKPFNPRELAITGTDSDGNPVIGGVPNMQTLDAGKRGLDEMLDEFRDKTTGKMVWNQTSKAIDAVRRSYVNELDNLNGDYKAARQVSGDYLSAQDAFHRGKRIVLNDNVTESQFAKAFNGLSEADKEAFKGGLVHQIHNLAQSNRLRPKLFFSPRVQGKMRAVFGQNEANDIIAKAQVEADMQRAGNRMKPDVNSPTAELVDTMADQDAPSKAGMALDAFDVAKKAYTGNPIGALRGAGKLLSRGRAISTTGPMKPEVRDEAGRLLMMPPSDLAAHLNRTSKAPALQAGKAVTNSLSTLKAPAQVAAPASLINLRAQLMGTSPDTGN